MTGANEILLDGIPITVCCQGQPALIPTIDTTEEFKVQTNTSPAEFGRTSGSILNILTKSGTNQFHGSRKVKILERAETMGDVPHAPNGFGKTLRVQFWTV